MTSSGNANPSRLSATIAECLVETVKILPDIPTDEQIRQAKNQAEKAEAKLDIAQSKVEEKEEKINDLKGALLAFVNQSHSNDSSEDNDLAANGLQATDDALFKAETERFEEEIMIAEDELYKAEMNRQDREKEWCKKAEELASMVTAREDCLQHPLIVEMQGSLGGTKSDPGNMTAELLTLILRNLENITQAAECIESGKSVSNTRFNFLRNVAERKTTTIRGYLSQKVHRKGPNAVLREIEAFNDGKLSPDSRLRTVISLMKDVVQRKGQKQRAILRVAMDDSLSTDLEKWLRSVRDEKSSYEITDETFRLQVKKCVILDETSDTERKWKAGTAYLSNAIIKSAEKALRLVKRLEKESVPVLKTELKFLEAMYRKATFTRFYEKMIEDKGMKGTIRELLDFIDPKPSEKPVNWYTAKEVKQHHIRLHLSRK